MAGLLTECHTILDAGVGTGRFAVPLGQRGLDIIGVDLSLEMMRRARTKGIGTLIRADLRRLPVSGEAVDGAFMAHVLQLVPDPGPVLRELGRVARRAVVILLPEWSEQLRTGAGRERRERYRELAAELGYPLPKRGKRYQHTIEELSAIAPPRAIREVSGPPLGPNREERMARWARMPLRRRAAPSRGARGDRPATSARTADRPYDLGPGPSLEVRRLGPQGPPVRDLGLIPDRPTDTRSNPRPVPWVQAKGGVAG